MLKKAEQLLCVMFTMCLLCSCALPEPQPTTTATKVPATVPTTVTSEPTVPEEPVIPAWKRAYLEFIEDKGGEFTAFALVFVDEDDVPELYLGGCSHAIGDRLCAYQAGGIKQLYIRRMQGCQYIPRSGLLVNYNGTVGYYYTEVFSLGTGGFDCLWSGLEKHGSGHNGFNEYYGSATYYIDDVRVSKAEYDGAIRGLIDQEKVIPLHENAVTYEEICQQIVDYEQ